MSHLVGRFLSRLAIEVRALRFAGLRVAPDRDRCHPAAVFSAHNGSFIIPTLLRHDELPYSCCPASAALLPCAAARIPHTAQPAHIGPSRRPTAWHHALCWRES